MAMFPTVRTIISARPTRIVLALVLIALSIWAFAPYVAYHVSSSAFINAEMMRVTAPISGYLSQDLPRKGKFIDHPERLTLIKSYATDRGHLFDLERQQSGAKGQAELAEKQLGEIASLDRELAKRMQAYRDGMIKRVGHEIKEAEAQETGCLAESLQLNDIGARMGKLAEFGDHLANPLGQGAGRERGGSDQVCDGRRALGAPQGRADVPQEGRLPA